MVWCLVGDIQSDFQMLTPHWNLLVVGSWLFVGPDLPEQRGSNCVYLAIGSEVRGGILFLLAAMLAPQMRYSHAVHVALEVEQLV